MCSKVGFHLVFARDLDLMITQARVQFGEDNDSVQLVHEFIHGWDREAVTDCNGIQGLIIDAESPVVFFLLD